LECVRGTDADATVLYPGPLPRGLEYADVRRSMTQMTAMASTTRTSTVFIVRSAIRIGFETKVPLVDGVPRLPPA
jgi:hypothetical protein